MPKTKKSTFRPMKKTAKAGPRFSPELGGVRPRFASPKETMSRLEARIPTAVYEMLEHAATVRGLTLTAYITATMGDDARRTIEQTEIIRLARADQIAFAEALIDPPAPNAKLLAAANRHAPMIRK